MRAQRDPGGDCGRGELRERRLREEGEGPTGGVPTQRDGASATLAGGTGAQRGRRARGWGSWRAGPGRQRRGEGRASAGGLGQRLRVSKRCGAGRAGEERSWAQEGGGGWAAGQAGRVDRAREREE